MRQESTRKLLIPGLLVLGLLGPMLAASWYSFSLQRATLSDSIEFEADQIIRTLVNGMVEPIWNLIPASGEPVLDSLMQEPHVVAIAVESIAQGPFLEASEDHPGGGARLTLEREIERNGVLIGHARVDLDAELLYAPMDEQWRHILMIGVAQAAIVVAVVLFFFRLSGRLQRQVVLSETNQRLEQEIGERRRAEEDARRSSDQLRLITNNLPVSIGFFDKEARLLFANQVWSSWNQWSPGEAIGKTMRSLRGTEYETFRKQIEGVLAGDPQTFERTVSYADGKTRVVRISYVPHKAPDGSILGYFALAEDVTEAKQVEERARQLQKTEAIGRLTGGVAHDFNNLLAVVQGNAELLTDAVGASNNSIRAILRASERGAELTRRLLAYSRQQPLRPEPVDLADLVQEMTGLLERALGESVAIETRIDGDLWPALADAGQVQDALLNLAINARDAMPRGGKLTIRCSNVSPAADAETADAFVALAVTDTGAGMPEEVANRAFEPFFTTKEVGKGSGLGLSMVEGFARQSGGSASIDSTPGEGTTVTILLPRAAGERADVRRRAAAAPGGDAEVVLVLEDDPDVRSLTVEMLTSLGYRVIDVPDAESAERVLLAGEKVDLALSDVVLPGISGPQWVAAAKKRFPDLRVVFMSGYSADALFTGGHLPQGDASVLLSKPVQRSELAQTISTALARH